MIIINNTITYYQYVDKKINYRNNEIKIIYKILYYSKLCGIGGIRTLEDFHLATFPTWCTRPLCDDSLYKNILRLSQNKPFSK